MIFDTTNRDQARKFKARVNFLYQKGAKIEILEKKKNRSYSQNNYLHLILGWYALEYGDTLEEIKQEHFKKIANPDIFKAEFVNQKTGEVRDRWRSTAELNTQEFSLATERFRNYAMKTLNLYLPEPKDLVHLDEIANQLEEHHNKIYL